MSDTNDQDDFSCAGALVILLGHLVLLPFCLMWAWNGLLVKMTELPTLSFKVSLSLVILATLAFGALIALIRLIRSR